MGHGFGGHDGMDGHGGAGGPSASRGAKLFVGQLPFECDDARLHELFGAYGHVLHVHILRDRGDKSKGAAFVTYATVEEADTAIFTLHNRYRMLTNRAIQVSYAKNSPNISRFGTINAVEVHQSNSSNPLPETVGASAGFGGNGLGSIWAPLTRTGGTLF
jgi:RNA recognition motif-containing protein